MIKSRTSVRSYKKDLIRRRKLNQFRGLMHTLAILRIIRTPSDLMRGLGNHLSSLGFNQKLQSRGIPHYHTLVSGPNSRRLVVSDTQDSTAQTRAQTTNPKLPQTLQCQTSSLTISTMPTWTPHLILSCSRWEPSQPQVHLVDRLCCQCLYFQTICISWSSRSLLISKEVDKRRGLSLLLTQPRPTASASFLSRQPLKHTSLKCANSYTVMWVWGTVISSCTDAIAWLSHRLTTSHYKLKCNLDEAFLSAQLRRRSYSIRRPIISDNKTTKLIAITQKHALTLSARVSQATQTRTILFKTKWRPSSDSTIHSFKMSNAITKSFKLN